jgi:hypothetical protein
LVQNSSLRGLLSIRSLTSEQLFVISAFLFEKEQRLWRQHDHYRRLVNPTCQTTQETQCSIIPLCTRGSHFQICYNLPSAGWIQPCRHPCKHWAYALVWRTMNALLFAWGDTWDLLDDECGEVYFPRGYMLYVKTILRSQGEWQDLHDDDKTCMQLSYWELILENGQWLGCWITDGLCALPVTGWTGIHGFGYLFPLIRIAPFSAHKLIEQDTAVLHQAIIV